jgi:type II secretory pathway pseudopilin PulG
MRGRDAAIQIHAKPRRNIARSEIVKSGVKNEHPLAEERTGRAGFSLSAFLSRSTKSKPDRLKPVLLALAAIGALSATGARTQQQANANPETALSDALSAACRQDSPAFANSLTAENATAFRALPGAQRTAMMKRFVLLEEPGRPLLSTSSNGQKIVRCESPSFTTEMRLGETRVRENLAFVPMEIPITGENPRKITFGLVREGGNWKLLSVGLIMLDVPAMAKQWEQADLEAGEDAAIADLRAVAAALDTYRRAYGNLPDTLAVLGPAPPNGVSPEAASLLDADLAAGSKDGYTIRYSIKPAAGSPPEEDANKAETFSLASSPKEYGKTGRRSFFLDSTGILRGADKQGSVATTTDPRIGPS